MSLNNQTKQTFASMSWARLTWRDRINIHAGNPNSLIGYFEYEDVKYVIYLPHRIIRIKCQTLSQMEVVSYNAKHQTNILRTPTDR